MPLKVLFVALDFHGAFREKARFFEDKASENNMSLLRRNRQNSAKLNGNCWMFRLIDEIS